ncbi:glutathione S-transferase family protein [Undibacterium sp. Rencai35W]|uniref:glutathione S-transferase family protein n=1 Tax=Undibacterium sp. Rencai35W TaxID=3413046 RepID=UPI003BF2E24F
MTIKIYGDIYSGNCYKIKLAAAQLQIPHDWVSINILNNETQTDSFLQKNPNGKVPLLELADGTCLSESNAILHYLAEGSSLLPEERLYHAQVLQWLFFEQYSHEPYIATARYIVRYLRRPAEHEERLQQKMTPGYHALDVMEQHLKQHQFFVAERYTIADIGLYAYTHVAHEGGFDLNAYPAIRAWLQRVEQQTGYLSMQAFDQQS